MINDKCEICGRNESITHALRFWNVYDSIGDIQTLMLCDECIDILKQEAVEAVERLKIKFAPAESDNNGIHEVDNKNAKV